MFKKIVLSILLLVLLSETLPLTFNVKLASIEETSETRSHELVRSILASTSTSAEVRFDSEAYTFITEREVGVGYLFNATIELYDVAEMFAWQIRVYYNNTLLNATDAHYHPDEPLSTVGGYPLSPVIANGYNSTHGYVQHAISALYPNHVNVTREDYPLGLGICVIEFQVIAEPASGRTLQSTLSIDNADTNLVKDPSTAIPCTKKNGLYRLISASIRIPTDYATIQEAINAADLGNTIFVYNGTYHENVVVNKTLMIVGQGADTVTINGTGGRVVIVEAVNDVSLDGFKIVSGSDGYCLYNSHFSKISSCIITQNSGNGIFLNLDCSNHIISDCTISENGNNGIYGRGDDGSVDSVSIIRNTIMGNSWNGVYGFASSSPFHGRGTCNSWLLVSNTISENTGYGVYARAGKDEHYSPGDCSYWKFYYNEIADNAAHGLYARAIAHSQLHWPVPSALESWANSWVVQHNCIRLNHGSGIEGRGGSRGDPVYPGRTYYGHISDWSVRNNTIYSNSDSGIYVAHYVASDGWMISQNSIFLNEYGLRLLNGDNILRGNTMDNNVYNFGVTGSFIQDVDISNTASGKPIYYLIGSHGGQVPADAGYIALVDSANITVRNFNLSHNEQGIMLIRTNNITLENIRVANNMYGIYLQESCNFTAYSNQAVNNTYGIYLKDSANGTLSGNKAINNTYGVYFKSSANYTITGNNIEENEYGIYLSGSSSSNIAHNNFLWNDKQATIDGTSVNVWDDAYPSGGNYWSEHTGPDWLSGIYQNETGIDGIVDVNMTIDQDNVDCYPLSALWSWPINIVMPGNTMHRGTEATLIFTLDFNSSWIGYSLDGQANVTISENITLTDLPFGWHQIIVSANDTLGNMWASVVADFAITFITDINYDQTVDISDLVETTWRYGSVPGDPRWNIYADVNQDRIIDIEDIALVANDYGKTWY